MNRTTLAILSVLACAPTFASADAAKAQDSDLLARVGTFGFLAGDWTCTGRVFAHGNVPARSTTARVQGMSVVGGRWVLFRYDEDNTAENPRPFHIDQYFGYDPKTRQFVSVALDSGGYFSETSPGWTGDSIVFDETEGGKIVGHDTFTRGGQDEFSHTGRSLEADGKWVETDQETCHRAR